MGVAADLWHLLVATVSIPKCPVKSKILSFERRAYHAKILLITLWTLFNSTKYK